MIQVVSIFDADQIRYLGRIKQTTAKTWYHPGPQRFIGRNKFIRRHLVKPGVRVRSQPGGREQLTIDLPQQLHAQMCGHSGCKDRAKWKIALRTFDYRSIWHYSGVTHGTREISDFDLSLLSNYITKERYRAIGCLWHRVFLVPTRISDVS